MSNLIKDINGLRLRNQLLFKGNKVQTPYDVVKWFCGMQAQDYVSAKWAIGVRLENSTDDNIEAAISNKSVVRTWSMRGTLQFVAGDDIKWLTDLFAEKRLAANSFRNRQLNLDRKLFLRCNKILYKALQGGNQLTRDEIKILFKQSGISVDGVQLSHILQNAAFEKLICFGVRRGSQFTFTLLDEWVPENKKLDREAALAELTKRYFRSRGPATIKDFIWWSGLSVGDARKGLALVKMSLISETINDETYWVSTDTKEAAGVKTKSTFLLPAFDEYLISYQDRSAMLDKEFRSRLVYINGMFYPVIVIKGKIAGVWKRKIKKDTVEIDLSPFAPLSESQIASIIKEIDVFGKFLKQAPVYNSFPKVKN